jgi:hypothetical protein
MITNVTRCLAGYEFRTTRYEICGRSSVVERHVANVNVVSSSLIARFSLEHKKRLSVTYEFRVVH